MYDVDMSIRWSEMINGAYFSSLSRQLGAVVSANSSSCDGEAVRCPDESCDPNQGRKYWQEVDDDGNCVWKKSGCSQSWCNDDANVSTVLSA